MHLILPKKIHISPPLFLTTPAYLWLTLTIFLPLTAMLFFSFLSEAPFGNRDPYLTLENYVSFFQKDFYQVLTWRSLRLGLEVTILCFLIGFPCALVLTRHISNRWREALFILVILPFWSNALVRIFSWTMILRGKGIIELILNWMNPEYGSFSMMFSHPAILLGLVHSYLPYMILTCYVSLQAIDETLIEAARSLGAGRMMILWKLIIPLSFPGISAGTVLIFVPVVGSFMEPRILGGSEGTFMGTIIEDQFVKVFNWPLGAALSFIMLALVMVILLVAYSISKKWT